MRSVAMAGGFEFWNFGVHMNGLYGSRRKKDACVQSSGLGCLPV